MTSTPHKDGGISAPADKLLTEQEAAAYLSLTVRALQNWRLRGGGPVYAKLGLRLVRYRRADLDAWIEAGRRHNTSHAA